MRVAASRHLAPWLLLVALALAGCGSTSPNLGGLPGPEGDFFKAKKSFEEKNWIRAIELLNAFVEAHPGSNQLDQALMMLGISHQKTGEYLLAIGEFERLTKDFPQSPLREEADYERAHSYLLDSPRPPYDPENTETAVTLLRSYVARYPDGVYLGEAQRGIAACEEKLAMKAFLNGKTYMKLKRYAAAIIYYKKALQTKPEFKRAGDAMADLAKAHEKVGQVDDARSSWQSLVDYATPERTRADSRLAKLRREAEEALGRLSGPAQDGARS
jgi:outer membrane assembly lipoprotein YfiO